MPVSAQPAATPAASLVDLLRGSALLASLSPERAALFATAANEKHYRKGKVLYLQDDAAEKLFFIRKGWVKLFRETLDGEEAISDILTSGHTFGETSIFFDGHYSESAQLVEDATLVEFPARLLKEEITTNPVFAQAMLSVMMKHRRRQAMEIEHLTVQNTAQRIGCFLLRLCSDKKGLGSVTLHLPYDKLLLAARLGMQPETFSRALAKLRTETNLSIQGATVVVPDLEKLVQYCCNACSNAYPCES